MRSRPEAAFRLGPHGIFPKKALVFFSKPPIFSRFAVFLLHLAMIAVMMTITCSGNVTSNESESVPRKPRTNFTRRNMK